jgi:membrane fusion protein (multidrug efflux system)
VEVIVASARGQKSVAEASLQASAFGAVANADQIREAEAQVTAATVARQQAQTELERTKQLFASGSLPKGQLDAAQTTFDAADASLAQTRAHLTVTRSSTSQAQARIQEARARLGQSSAVDAQIEQARARAAQARARAEEASAKVLVAKAQRELAWVDWINTKVYATRAGIASKKSVVIGQVIGAGQPVAMIVPVREVWVTANFKETQLHKMKVGQPAEVEIDAYPGLKVRGEVESFSGATGSRFSLLPPDNATGNFTKVVQRVPVRIKLLDLPEDKVLRPGMSADVTVDERK